MAGFFKSISSAASNAYSYMAHGENARAFAEKEHIVDLLMKRSLKVYHQTALKNDSRTLYAERLHDVLKKARTSSLKILLKKNVVVCLDPRLMKQDIDVKGRCMQAVYTPQGPFQPAAVLALRDNGVMQRDIGFFYNDFDSCLHAGEIIDELSIKIQNEETALQKLVAGLYHATRSTLRAHWNTLDKFGCKTPAKNPALLRPPPGGAYWPQKNKPRKPG
ncbi:MAG: hypothetical protein GC185_08555 [Alphaproteobacteria bacterium]|nr:hypothetical protein [Alphaproteobacteria bacterium]